MPVRAKRALLITNDPKVSGRILSALREVGVEITSVGSIEGAKRHLATSLCPVAIVCASLPEISALELLAYIGGHASACRAIVISSARGREYVAEALRLGAYDCFGKPFDAARLAEATLAALNEESPFRYLPAEMVRTMPTGAHGPHVPIETIRALAYAVEARDIHTRRHSEHVAHYAVNLARELDLPPSQGASLRTAALLHDIGRISIPDSILTKPGPLSPREFEYVRRHPVISAQILEGIGVFGAEVPMVRAHHENWDGSGYPDGLQGEEICLGARILRVADSMDAMLMPRSYRDSYPLSKLLDELATCAGSRFSPGIAAAAVQWCHAHADALIQPACMS